MVSQPHQDPTVSVIIPAYNVAEYISEALQSVTSQTFSDFEVIVINDGSSDTEELERALEPFRERITYLKQENGGAGAARNNGLVNARGKYVAFLDADDIWLPNFLTEMVAFIERDGGRDLVYANALLFGKSTVSGLTYMDTNPSAGEVSCESLLAERCNIITSGVLTRRDRVLEAGLFDLELRNSQDFDLWVRLAKRPGVRMAFTSDVLLKQRHRPGSLASDSIRSVEAELRVLAKTAQRDDLTTAERAAIENTVALRQASLAVDRGKVSLKEGDFAAARRSFQTAFEYYRSWKLRLVLFGLRLSPRTLQHLYRLRMT